MKELVVINLGRTKYREVWDLQRRMFQSRLDGEIPDVLLLTEHDHVYTIGKSGDDNHLLASHRELFERSIEVFHVDRGGDVTYHGPGQLVGYPIIDLNSHYLDIHRYLRDIEEAIIRTLAQLGIPANRDGQYTGVWVGSNKIAAIGVKVSRWITMHGFALNVSTDLTYFDRIIPCGIFHKGVTSIEEVLGKSIPLQMVSDMFRNEFAGVFDYSLTERKDLPVIDRMVYSTAKDHRWHPVENQ